jgi:hypothetical protein
VNSRKTPRPLLRQSKLSFTSKAEEETELDFMALELAAIEIRDVIRDVRDKVRVPLNEI